MFGQRVLRQVSNTTATTIRGEAWHKGTEPTHATRALLGERLLEYVPGDGLDEDFAGTTIQELLPIVIHGIARHCHDRNCHVQRPQLCRRLGAAHDRLQT